MRPGRKGVPLFATQQHTCAYHAMHTRSLRRRHAIAPQTRTRLTAAAVLTYLFVAHRVVVVEVLPALLPRHRLRPRYGRLRLHVQVRRLVRQSVIGRVQTDVALGRIERVQAARVGHSRSGRRLWHQQLLLLLLLKQLAIAQITVCATDAVAAAAHAATVLAGRFVVHFHFGQLYGSHCVHRL